MKLKICNIPNELVYKLTNNDHFRISKKNSSTVEIGYSIFQRQKIYNIAQNNILVIDDINFKNTHNTNLQNFPKQKKLTSQK